MKKIATLSALIIVILLIITGCSKKNDSTIETDIESYALTSSATKGITLKPKSVDENNQDMKFHWTTSDGSLIVPVYEESSSGVKEIYNNGESVLWQPSITEKDEKGNVITITLNIEKSNLNNEIEMLSESKLEIEYDGINYIVKK